MERHIGPDFHQSLQEISQNGFQSQLYSDLTIRCKDHSSGELKEFHVHKLVVCLQSEFFANACKPDSPFMEARTGVITLDDDAFLISLLLTVFYTRYVKTVLPMELQHFSPHVPSEEAAVVCYAMLYSLADKYQAMHAKVQLTGAVALRLEAASVKLKSNRPGAISIASFVRVANTVFTTTPDSDRTLRNLIYRYTKKHFKLLMDAAQFHSEMNGVEGFWSGYARYLSFCVKKKRACPECEQPATNGSDDIMFEEGVLGMLCPVDGCEEFSSLDDWNRPAQTTDVDGVLGSTCYVVSCKRQHLSSDDGD